MAIEKPLIIPNPSALVFTAVDNVQASVSTFTRSAQVVQLLGGHWQFVARWDIVTREQLPAFRAFLGKLRGGVEQFYFSDVLHPLPFGDVSGNVEITGSTIETVSVTTTTPDTIIFMAGDYIEVPTESPNPNEYKMILDDVTTDGAGLAVITVRPFFRHVPLVAANIIYNNPRGLFMSLEPAAGWNSTAPGQAEGITITAIEWVV